MGRDRGLKRFIRGVGNVLQWAFLAAVCCFILRAAFEFGKFAHSHPVEAVWGVVFVAVGGLTIVAIIMVWDWANE